VRRDCRLDATKDEVTPARSRTAALAAVVAVVTIVAFLPALGADFVTWDDERNFLTNPHYRGLGLEQLRWMWSTTLLGHYVPLSWMTLGLDYVLWGMDPRGYHLTNILLHAVNALLVFALARILFRAARPGAADDATADIAAALAALAFAAHPLRVESVAWITERRDVLSMLFGLLSVLSYLRATSGGSFQRRPYFASIAFFVCALLSKGTSVTVPAVLLILNWYPLRRLGGTNGWWSASARRVYAEMIPFAIPAAGFMILSVVALRPPDQLPLAGKIAVTAYSLVFYLAKTIFPAKLIPLYSMPVTVDPFAGRFVPGYVGTVVFIGVVLFAMRRRPGVAAALLAFAAVSLPMLGIVQNGPQIAADRYTYHAAPALTLLAAAGWLALAKRASLAAASAIGAIVVVALATLTWRQTGFWKDSERLWGRVLAIEPESPLGNSAWANLLFKQNKVDEAIAYSVRAVRAAPQFAEGHNDLGVGLARKGDFAAAVDRYRASLALKPGFDEAENNWGVVLAAQGQLDSAVAHYRRALAANPENPDAEVNLGNVLVRQGKTGEAIGHYQRALWIRPDHADAHHNWGVALARDGRLTEAIPHFEAALSIHPAHVEARDYLGRATQLLRDQRGR
jgi:tetratricopeptide (TPR) repeat protein